MRAREETLEEGSRNRKDGGKRERKGEAERYKRESKALEDEVDAKEERQEKYKTEAGRKDKWPPSNG